MSEASASVATAVVTGAIPPLSPHTLSTHHQHHPHAFIRMHHRHHQLIHRHQQPALLAPSHAQLFTSHYSRQHHNLQQHQEQHSLLFWPATTLLHIPEPFQHSVTNIHTKAANMVNSGNTTSVPSVLTRAPIDPPTTPVAPAPATASVLAVNNHYTTPSNSPSRE